MIQVKDKSFEVYINEQTLHERIQELGKQISADYGDQKPLFVAILNGSFIFAADLMKAVSIPCEITFIKVSSYKGTHSTGKMTELVGLQEDIANRHVVIIEDIVDTGITMEHIWQSISAKKPLSLAVATLLFKPDSLQKEVQLKYVGFEIPPTFVVGYGLDYDGFGRNLPDLYVLKA
jgi:hypoxanthine phosphoribosyltransferase